MSNIIHTKESLELTMTLQNLIQFGLCSRNIEKLMPELSPRRIRVFRSILCGEKPESKSRMYMRARSLDGYFNKKADGQAALIQLEYFLRIHQDIRRQNPELHEAEIFVKAYQIFVVSVVDILHLGADAAYVGLEGFQEKRVIYKKCKECGIEFLHLEGDTSVTCYTCNVTRTHFCGCGEPIIQRNPTGRQFQYCDACREASRSRKKRREAAKLNNSPVHSTLLEA